MKMISESEMSRWQLDTIQYYCDCNLRELKKICNPIIIKKNVPSMHHDDLYSDAMNVLMESVIKFNEDVNCSFKTFLVGNIKRSFYDWTRDNERAIRCNVLKDKEGNIIKDENGRNITIQNVSIDQPLNDEDNTTYRDLIASNYNIYDELSDEIGLSKDDKIEMYLKRLSKMQRRIVILLRDGYKKPEIKDILHIEEKEYSNNMLGIRAYENVRVLY